MSLTRRKASKENVSESVKIKIKEMATLPHKRKLRDRTPGQFNCEMFRRLVIVITMYLEGTMCTYFTSTL